MKNMANQCIKVRRYIRKRQSILSQVIASLSLELYFKSLYCFVFNKEFKINNKHSHDFDRLFLELPNDIQDFMNEEFRTLLAKRDMKDVERMESFVKVPRDLVGNLKYWRKGFVEIRYFHDKPKEPIVMMFFPEIEKVVIKAIRKVKPNLAKN
jgi:hypothetical protein